MRMTVFQPVGVYPPPARNAWQLVHCATTISFPFPSGSSWLRAGNAEQKRTAATRDGSFDTLRVLQRVAVRAFFASYCERRGKSSMGYTWSAAHRAAKRANPENAALA